MNDAPRPPAFGVTTEALIPRKNDVLAEICRAIARSANHLDVVQESALRLQRYFGTHGVTLFFKHEGRLVLRALALPEHLSHLVPEVEAQWGEAPNDDQRPSVQAMRLRRIVRYDASDPRLPHETRELLRLGSAAAIIAVPVFVDGEPMGACVVITPDRRPLNAADEILLEDALGVVGIVYQRGEQRVIELEHQRQAIAAHNLAVVGELASGVAHEINNPLNTIVHFCEILLQSALPPETQAHLRAIRGEALRAASTVSSLQTFARQDATSAPSMASLGQAMRAIADLEKHQLAVSNVDLRIEIPGDLPAVRSDPASLRRVLHNLIANARHAIHQTRRAGEITVRAASEGAWVRISIEDTGIGLTGQVADSMFRPFFTTRPPGEGAGLGLAVAYGVVREHDGEIEGENWGRPPALGGEPGQGGARFTVWLRAESLAAPPAPPARDARGEPIQPLSVLLVEDESLVAQALTTLLARDGHQVTLVASAEAAVAALEGTPGVGSAPPGASTVPGFDAILSDYRMPGMGGEGLYEWMRTSRPDLLERLVFMSGDLLSPRTQAFLEDAGRPVLAKPFTRDALREILAPLAR